MLCTLTRSQSAEMLTDDEEDDDERYAADGEEAPQEENGALQGTGGVEASEGVYSEQRLPSQDALTSHEETRDGPREFAMHEVIIFLGTCIYIFTHYVTSYFLAVFCHCCSQLGTRGKVGRFSKNTIRPHVTRKTNGHDVRLSPTITINCLSIFVDGDACRA